MRGRTTRLLTICTILLASLSGVEATEKAEEVKEDFWAKMVERVRHNIHLCLTLELETTIKWETTEGSESDPSP